MLVSSSRWCVTAVFALGSLACSDPVAPPAQGAFITTIAAASPAPQGKACPTSVSFTYDVPNINMGTPTEALTGTKYLHKVVDGENDASVSCKVAGSGPFQFSGSLKLGVRSLSINSGTIGADNKGTAQVTVSNREALSSGLTSPGATCTVQVISSNGVPQIKGGSMWASFSCPSVEAVPTEYCTASGFFVLENCDQ